MCQVIVTARSLLWVLLSLIAVLAIISAILTPRWLIGPSQYKLESDNTSFTPTVGLYARCTRLHGRPHCGPLAPDSEHYPGLWYAALAFLSLGAGFGVLTVFAGIMGFCIQACCRKSVFTLSGAAQSIAGILYIIGGVLYAAGWGAPRVVRLCGPESVPFYPDDCELGWAFYSCLGGILLTFICSVLSVQAEASTSSDKVEFQIHQGRTLICLP